MKDLIRKNRWFLIPYSVLLTVSVLLLIFFSKPELHIVANKANSPFFDTFFKYATLLGDGTLIAVLTIILLFVSFRHLFAFLLGSLSAAAVVNIIKKFILTDIYRPSKYFELFETYQLHFIEGVKLHSYQSFPSGHTAAIFSVALMLTLLTRNNLLKVSMLLVAVLTAYSRVYLSQHFFIDITVGSVIAVLLMLLFFRLSESWKKPWLDKSVLTISKSSK